jgi:predicted O-linked N-acetylglucosamine transferase (SPINDLY family)
VLALCTGSPFKYAPENDWVFPEIARRARGCRLIFFQLDPKTLCEQLERRLADTFSRAGLDFRSHVSFLPKLSRPRFYGLMQRAGLWLDTFRYSGFNTAMQAVECGLPLVAREGRFMRGRFASGILRQLGMHEWVATSDEQYVELAAALANDAEKRRAARVSLEASRGMLFDDPAPVRALEDFLSGATRQSA